MHGYATKFLRKNMIEYWNVALCFSGVKFRNKEWNENKLAEVFWVHTSRGSISVNFKGHDSWISSSGRNVVILTTDAKLILFKNT